MKLKIVGLIVNVNSQSVEQNVTYDGNLLLIFKSVTLQPIIVVLWMYSLNIFAIS